MKTMQDMITGEIEQQITSAGLVMVKAARFGNEGTLHAVRGVEPLLAIEYSFQVRSATLVVSGTAVEQAPFEFLTRQHQLRHNRVWRDARPVVPYDVEITPEHVADRRGLSIAFHKVEYGEPGEVQEFLDVLRKLLPTAPAPATPGEDAGQEADQLVALVMRRPDAAEALNFVLAQPTGGPSCGCGGSHWSCPADTAKTSSGWTADDAAELAGLEAAFDVAGGRGVDLAEQIDALRARRDAGANGERDA